MNEHDPEFASPGAGATGSGGSRARLGCRSADAAGRICAGSSPAAVALLGSVPAAGGGVHRR